MSHGTKIVGLIAIRMNWLAGFVDKQGSMIFKPQFEEYHDWSQPDITWIAVRYPDEWLWGIINPYGEIIKPQFYDVGELCEGMAKVRIETQWGFINEYGTIVIEPQYREAGYFRLDRARVQLDRKWGFINKKGEMVIDPKYEYASNYYKKGAMVQYRDKWGIIDVNENYILEPKYEDPRLYPQLFWDY